MVSLLTTTEILGRVGFAEPALGQMGQNKPTMAAFRETTNEESGRKQHLANPMMQKSTKAGMNEELPIGRNRTMTTKGLAASTVNMLTVPQKDKSKVRSSSNDRMREEDVNVLYEKHEHLIETLLLEEDKIIDDHKSLIDNMINSIKNDSILFQNLQSQRSLPIISEVDIPSYMDELMKLLVDKEKAIGKLKRRLVNYQAKAEEEDAIRNRLEKHEDNLRDVFDLKTQGDQDFELLDGIEN